MVRRLLATVGRLVVAVLSVGAGFIAFVLWSDDRQDVARIEQHRGLM